MKSSKFLSVLLATALCFASPGICLAKGGVGHSSGGGHSFSSGSHSSGGSSHSGGWGGSSAAKSSSGSGWGGTSGSHTSTHESSSDSGWGGSSAKTSKPSSDSDSGWGGSSSKSSTSAAEADTKPKSSFGWGGSTRDVTTNSKVLRSERPTIHESTPEVDRQVYERAKASGKAFASRDDAAKAFKESTIAKQYTSTYSSEPSIRPGYIPQTYYTGSQRVTVIYDHDRGGYGYMDPTLGVWMMYNALEDASMRDQLMAQHGYYGGPPPIYPTRSHWVLWTLLCTVLTVGVVLIVLGVTRNNATNSSRSSRY